MGGDQGVGRKKKRYKAHKRKKGEEGGKEQGAAQRSRSTTNLFLLHALGSLALVVVEGHSVGNRERDTGEKLALPHDLDLIRAVVPKHQRDNLESLVVAALVLILGGALGSSRNLNVQALCTVRVSRGPLSWLAPQPSTGYYCD